MPTSILSRKKGILLFIVATCLITALIAAWRVYPLRAQTSGPIQVVQEGKAMSQMIDNLKSSGAQFRAVELLQTEQAPALTSFVSSDELKQGVTLNFNSSAASLLSASNDQTITFRLPDPQGALEAVELELTRVNIFSEGFKVTTSSSNGAPVNHQPGAHFRGAVKGAPGSLAAVSVFNNEVAGLYSLPDRGNFVLGKLKGDNPNNVHVLYSDADLKRENTWVCGTKDDKREVNKITPSQDLTDVETAIPDGCVDVYVEADRDLFLKKGNLSSTTDYLETIFNQSAAIFANDGIQIALSGFFVWDTPSPYAGLNTTNALLAQFQTSRNLFIGDIGHLVALRGGGGLAPIGNDMCNDDWDARQGFSDIDETSEIIDDFSWTVFVITHEMGHLMGSHHTQDCEWVVNGVPNQAIDGCAEPNPIGGCSRPGIPAEGGTIMSYCHCPDLPNIICPPENQRIRFANGFGPLPGERIRNRISAASCIADCVKDCNYVISPTSLSLQANGASGSILVTTANGCNWTAVSDSSFITITSGSSGFGAGIVNYSVAQNGITPRTGKISVGGKEFIINQAGCATINPTSSTFLGGGGSGTVTVSAINGCNWTAVSNSSFIIITSGASGSGNGTVRYSVATNSATSSRTGTITIAGKTFIVNQAGNGELIVNGGFESGLSPWVLGGNAYRSTGSYPYSGKAYAVVVDGNNETGSVYQSITIPNGALRELTFRLNVSSQETATGTAWDKLFVEVLYRDGSLLLRRTLAQFSNLHKGSAGVYSLRGPYILDDFEGQTVQIQFRAVNDYSLPTYFRIDSVSVRPPLPGN